MMKALYLLGGTALALAVFAILNNPDAVAEGVGSVGDRLSDWGTRQRLGGAGGELKGRVKQGFSNLTGDTGTGTSGVLDEAAGLAKDTLGQAAQTVGNTLRNVNS